MYSKPGQFSTFWENGLFYVPSGQIIQGESFHKTITCIVAAAISLDYIKKQSVD